jgi:hypothetical protein
MERLGLKVTSDFLAMGTERPKPESQAIVPPGAPGWVSESLIRTTLEVWQPFANRPLTPDDALAMLINISQLFEVVGLTSPEDRES